MIIRKGEESLGDPDWDDWKMYTMIKVQWIWKDRDRREKRDRERDRRFGWPL